MSSQTRLFVGNIPESTNENELRSAFSVYGKITNLDIKSKSTNENDQKKFAFVTLAATNYDIESCIKNFGNVVFNGNQLYVTRARESFLERLQRERDQAHQKKETDKIEIDQQALPKTNPVIILGEKLNPHKRKNDAKSCLSDTTHKPVTLGKLFKKSANDNLVDFMPVSGVKNFNAPDKDKKKQDADKKRMESIKQKRQEFKYKQMVIKTGLGGIDKVSNKKIIFTDDEENTSQDQHVNENNKIKKNTLFDDDGDSDNEVNFEIKTQFEGKQGQKVLDLQSRYKTDKRFILDERFIEDEQLDMENEQQTIEEDEAHIYIAAVQTDEKVKQLNILQDVLGVAIKSHHTQPNDLKDNKKIKSKMGMLRFDPMQPDHAKFLAPVEEIKQDHTKKSKKKKPKENPEMESQTEKLDQEKEKVEVSKEQFYKVSETLKDTLEQPTTFSLRSLFSKSENIEEETKTQESTYVPLATSKERKVKNPLDPGTKNPFVYDSSDSEVEEEEKTENADLIPEKNEIKIVWKENLFFSESDGRLKDGLDFFNKISQDDGQKERRELKSLMKKRIYNKERKSQMFQKKIGGRKKSLKKSYNKRKS